MVFFERRGILREDLENKLEEIGAGKLWYRELEKRESERQREERWERIRNSNYNK